MPTLLDHILSMAPHRNSVVLWMNIAHYIKREFETVFVHRFSKATMPIRNLPKNCAHYWILGGVMLAVPLYWPSANPNQELATWQWSCLGAWIWAQLSNFKTHITLRNLRRPGTRERNIPFGYGFKRVTCPNYTFEIISWVVMACMTQNIFVVIFALVGARQMYAWALKKHKQYITEFGDKYPRSRRLLVPHLL